MVNYVETNKAAFGNGNDESDLKNVKNRKFSKLTTETLVIIGRQVKATGAYILIVGSLNSRSASFFFIFRYASNFQVFSKFSTTL